MALIKCPECKKKISDQCDNCPHCGYPIQDYIQQQHSVSPSEESAQQKKASKKTGLIIGIAVAVVVTVASAIILWSQGVFTKPFSENTAAIEAADASVVKIFCYDFDGDLAATGSGFIVYDSRTVVTNYHVMTSAYTCKISTNQDVSYEVADILCFSKELDLAFLQLKKDTELQPLTFGNSADIKKGETVVAIGSPLGIKNTVSTGVLSGRPTENNMEILQFTAPISSGSSGGALFDNNGNVIGITYASYEDGQNLNLAIPAEKAVDLYETRQRSVNIFTIYEEEHPYTGYLQLYPWVTLTELKTNPEKYDDKPVVLTAYVSSLGLDSDGEWKYSLLFVSEKADITKDIDYDFKLHYNSALGFQDCPSIECNLANCRVPDDILDINEGDKVVLIGKFDYTAIGEVSGWNDYVYTQAYGEFDVTYICVNP